MFPPAQAPHHLRPSCLELDVSDITDHHLDHRRLVRLHLAVDGFQLRVCARTQLGHFAVIAAEGLRQEIASQTSRTDKSGESLRDAQHGEIEMSLGVYLRSEALELLLLRLLICGDLTLSLLLRLLQPLNLSCKSKTGPCVSTSDRRSARPQKQRRGATDTRL